MSIVASAQKKEDTFHLCLFEEKSFSTGIGAPYSVDQNLLGINGRLYYNIRENICFGPEVSFLKNQETELIDFNFVGHYIFETKLVGIYPLIGLNYTIEQFELEKESKFGAVFGIGVHRNFKKITSFVEYSKVASKLSDNFIIIGILYNLRLNN